MNPRMLRAPSCFLSCLPLLYLLPQAVLRCAAMHSVPVVYALSRRGIGTVFGRDKSMSIVAVMVPGGVEAPFVSMLELASQVRSVCTC